MKKVELIKFISGIIFCSISVLGCIVFFLGYWGITIGYMYGSDSSFERIWCNNYSSGSTSNTPYFLGICAVVGAYLLANVKSED